MTQALRTICILAVLSSLGCGGGTDSPISSEPMSIPSESSEEAAAPALEIHGHRGARGLLPENTIPGFILAIREGSDVLEMDLCISKDDQVIVSHEPWMSHEICTHADGQEIAAESERDLNLRQMTLEEIQTYDCGMHPHPRFPNQRQVPAHKPALAEVVDMAEKVPMLSEGRKIRYNLEIKHHQDLEPAFCPDATTFAQLVIDEVNRLGISDRTCIQSFSTDALEAVHQIDPDITTALLVESEGDCADQLARLSFTPSIYSPQWQLIDADDVHALQGQNIRVIPWTVNQEEDLYAVMQIGVDGIITDYPDRLYSMLDE